MPAPLQLRDNPWFMEDMYKYGADQTQNAPDPRLLGRDESDMMRLVNAMLGPNGYMDYIAKLKEQRKKKTTGKPAAPAAPPRPTLPPDMGPELRGGILETKKRTRQEEIEELERQAGIRP